MDQPIRSVIIAGGGIVAWSAAAAIRRRLPVISVTVVPIPPCPAAFADRSSCTLPSIAEFHSDIRLDDSDVMARARSDVRLGTRFEGWGGTEPDYIHAYGDYGAPLGAAPFHQHWLRARQAGKAAPFDRYSVAAQMARAGKFAAPEASVTTQGGRFGFGLYIDPPRYREMMQAYALHLGATMASGKLAKVELHSADGSIDSLQLDDGATISGDLFVDATGPEARLRGLLDRGWEDWTGWLIADRALCGEGEAASPQIVDSVAAVTAGWTWICRSSVRTSAGVVYSSHHFTDDAAAELLNGIADDFTVEEPVRLKQGRWTDPWSRNCVAIGDAAVAVEPLEWANLHLASSAIDRLIATMPDRSFNSVELCDYNRQATAEADRVRDFLIMHYLVSKGPGGGFWNAASSVDPPPSLEHTITQFCERGRLPFYEEETFSRDSWLVVLLGQGIVPNRVDPLIDTIPPEQSESGMAKIEQTVSQFVDSLPAYSRFLEILKQKIA